MMTAGSYTVAPCAFVGPIIHPLKNTNVTSVADEHPLFTTFGVGTTQVHFHPLFPISWHSWLVSKSVKLPVHFDLTFASYSTIVTPYSGVESSSLEISFSKSKQISSQQNYSLSSWHNVKMPFPSHPHKCRPTSNPC